MASLSLFLRFPPPWRIVENPGIYKSLPGIKMNGWESRSCGKDPSIPDPWKGTEHQPGDPDGFRSTELNISSIRGRVSGAEEPPGGGL